MSPTSMFSSDDGPRRVLVVDDNAVNRKVLARQLSVLGFTSIVTDSASKALDAMERDHFDLLITDLRMPGINGIEFAERVRELSQSVQIRVPIVLLTADATVEQGPPASSSPVDVVLVKPVDLDTLGACLKKLLPEEAGQGLALAAGSQQISDCPAGSDLFDLDYLGALARRGVNVFSLLQEWRREVDEDLARLDKYRRCADLAGVRSSLHRLSGSMGLVGSRLLMSDFQQSSTAQQMPETCVLDCLVATTRKLVEQLKQAPLPYGSPQQ